MRRRMPFSQFGVRDESNGSTCEPSPSPCPATVPSGSGFPPNGDGVAITDIPHLSLEATPCWEVISSD